jgi:hypothetical protein
VTSLRRPRSHPPANQHNHAENQKGVENTSLIGQILGQAAEYAQQLDAIMNNEYPHQPEKLRAWKFH